MRIDFLKKHGIFAGWTPTGKFKLITQQEFLVESLEVLMKGPMIHNKQGIEIPEKKLDNDYNLYRHQKMPKRPNL